MRAAQHVFSGAGHVPIRGVAGGGSGRVLLSGAAGGDRDQETAHTEHRPVSGAARMSARCVPRKGLRGEGC